MTGFKKLPIIENGIPIKIQIAYSCDAFKASTVDAPNKAKILSKSGNAIKR